jgi:hypothetical protein
MLRINIKTGGAAYSEDDNITIEGRYELKRNLKAIAEKIVDGFDEGFVMDINGNKVGTWSIK